MRMVGFVENVGRNLIGYQIQSVSNVDILFRQIWIWDRTGCVRTVRQANVNWILFAVHVYMMMHLKI